MARPDFVHLPVHAGRPLIIDLHAIHSHIALAGIGIAQLGDLAFTVVGADGEAAETEFDAHFDIVPASLAKGLEFDHVVLADPAGIVAGEPDRVTGLRRLYVCLTRAVSTLSVHHANDLPAELAE